MQHTSPRAWLISVRTGLAMIMVWCSSAAFSRPPNRFVILSDLHPHPDQYETLDRLVEHVVALRPAFVIVLGDVGSDQVPGLSEREIAAIRVSFNRLRSAGIEIYPVMGNHDVHPRVEAIKTQWFCSPTPLPLNPILDRSSNTEAAHRFLHGGPYDYSFDRGGIHFVILDSNCVPPQPNWTPERARSDTPRWNVHERWMADELCQNANHPSRPPTLIFLHHPEYMTGDRRMDERPLYHALRGCEKGHQVKAVFGGHWHYGQNFPPDSNLGVQVYATPASVHPKPERIEFIVAEVSDERITFEPRDSVTGEVRTSDAPVKYAPITGRFGSLSSPPATRPAATAASPGT